MLYGRQIDGSPRSVWNWNRRGLEEKRKGRKINWSPRSVWNWNRRGLEEKRKGRREELKDHRKQWRKAHHWMTSALYAIAASTSPFKPIALTGSAVSYLSFSSIPFCVWFPWKHTVLRLLSFCFIFYAWIDWSLKCWKIGATREDKFGGVSWVFCLVPVKVHTVHSLLLRNYLVGCSNVLDRENKSELEL